MSFGSSKGMPAVIPVGHGCTVAELVTAAIDRLELRGGPHKFTIHLKGSVETLDAHQEVLAVLGSTESTAHGHFVIERIADTKPAGAEVHDDGG